MTNGTHNRHDTKTVSFYPFPTQKLAAKKMIQEDLGEYLDT